MLQVIGYEHKEGIKKSTGKPYCLSIVYCQDDVPIFPEYGHGSRVEVIIVNEAINGAISCVPQPGDYIRPIYNRQGYTCDVERINT